METTGVVTLSAVWRMIRSMSPLRHALAPLVAALLAALAVLFVSTASMACDVPIDQDVMSMSMSDDSGPCGPKTESVSCQKACLIYCQGLISLADATAPSRNYTPVRYPSLDADHADFTMDADDPPPRT